MSRNLYTIATINAGCDLGLRAVLAATGEAKIVAAEEYLHDAATAPEPKVAFYRVVLDGWNTTHCELGASLSSLSPMIGERLGQLQREQFVLFEPDELRVLEAAAPPGDRSDNPGWHSMTAFWDAIRQAGVFAAGTGCRVVVTWRVLCRSFGDEDFRVS